MKTIDNKIIHFAFFLIGLTIFSSCKSIDYIKYANIYKERNNYSVAHYFANQHLKHNGNDINALRLKATLEERMNKNIQAKRTYEKMIILAKPSELQPLDFNDYANILYKMEEIDSAIFYFSRLFEFDSTLSPVNFNLAVIYFEEFDSLETALAYIDRELINNKDDIPSLLLKGDILLEMEYFDQATRVAEHVLQIDSTLSKAYIILGRCTFLLEQYRKALKNYTIAISYNKRNPSYYLRRGATNALLKDYHAALTDYNKAIALDKSYIEAYEGRLDVYKAMGKSKKACKDIKKLIKISKSSRYMSFPIFLRRK